MPNLFAPVTVEFFEDEWFPTPKAKEDEVLLDILQAAEPVVIAVAENGEGELKDHARRVLSDIRAALAQNLKGTPKSKKGQSS